MDDNFIEIVANVGECIAFIVLGLWMAVIYIGLMAIGAGIAFTFVQSMLSGFVFGVVFALAPAWFLIAVIDIIMTAIEE